MKKLYQSGLDKYNESILNRNCVDDFRLALEVLLKELLSNQKSLENQIESIGKLLKSNNISKEMRNIVIKMTDGLSNYNNAHMKHNHSEGYLTKETTNIIELTSFLIRFYIENLVF